MASPPVELAGIPLHPLLADHRSRPGFDPSADVVSQELAALLEAARWAPSHRNSQPWRFVVGRRGDQTHQRVLAELPAADRSWAGRAPVLLVAAHLTRSETGGALPQAGYDLGQAVAHLCLQAAALDLSAHQLADLDPGRLRAGLGLPADTRPVVVIAVGRPAVPAAPDGQPADPAPARHPVGLLLLG